MRALLALILCTLASVVLAQRQITSIEVNYADPEQIAAVIKPYLSAGSSVSLYQNRLVLNVTDEELAKTRELLGQLDGKGRQLLVTLRSEGTGSDSHRSIDVSGVARSGDSTVFIEPDPGARTNGKGIAVTQSNTTVRTSSSRGTSTGKGSQSLRVTEGIAAYISTGLSAPIQSYSTGPDGRRYYQQDYVDAVTGFYATTRVNDGVVQISIDQSNDQYDGGTIATQQLRSQVSGALGQWLPIGVLNDAGNQQNRGIGSRSQSGQASSTQLYIKVELLD